MLILALKLSLIHTNHLATISMAYLNLGKFRATLNLPPWECPLVVPEAPLVASLISRILKTQKGPVWIEGTAGRAILNVVRWIKLNFNTTLGDKLENL